MSIMKTTSNVARACAFAVGALTASACSGSGRPAASDELGTADPVRPPTSAEDAAAEACPPRTKRECMQTFVGADGKMIDCRPSFEWCRADGSGWHPCGKARTGANGEDVAPD